MKYGIVVVAVQTVLQEVATCERSLFCEKLDGQVAGCGVEHNFRCRLRLEVVEVRHGRGGVAIVIEAFQSGLQKKEVAFM